MCMLQGRGQMEQPWGLRRREERGIEQEVRVLLAVGQLGVKGCH